MLRKRRRMITRSFPLIFQHVVCVCVIFFRWGMRRQGEIQKREEREEREREREERRRQVEHGKERKEKKKKNILKNKGKEREKRGNVV